MASRNCRYSGFSRLRKLARHQIMKTWPIFSSSVSLCRVFSAHFSPLRSRRSGPACWYLSFAKAIDAQVRTSSKVVSLWRIGEKDSRSGGGSKSLLPLGLRFSKRLSRRGTRWQGSGIVEYGELDLLLHRINAVDQHPDAFAHAVSFASALSNNLPRVLVIQVTVVVEGVEWDQPFDEKVGQFDEETKLGNAGNETVEILSHAFLHELDLLPFHEFAFGVVGAALGLAGLLGDVVQLVERDGSAERVMGFAMSGMIATLRPWRGGIGVRAGMTCRRATRRGVSIAWPGSHRYIAFPLFRRIAQHVFQNPVHDEVRIASDRRCKVRVTGRRQREMPQIFFRIPCLLERPKHQVTENAFLRLPRDLLRQFLIHARRDVNFLGHFDLSDALAGTIRRSPVGFQVHPLDGQRTYAQRIPKSGGDDFEVVNPFGVRLFVNPVERSGALRLDILGDALVGREHEFLNQPVCHIAFRARDALHQSELVEFDHRLRQVEVDRSPSMAFAVQDQSQVTHEFEPWHQSGITLAHNGIALEHGVDRGIGHALGRANHAVRQLVAHDFAARVDLHHARHDQPVRLRSEAADVGGKLQREHGHGPVGKVHAGTPQASFLVQRRARGHVVGDIRDVNLQFEVAIRQCRYHDRVIEVTRRLPVDGDDRKMSEIAAMMKFVTWNNGWDRLGLFENFRGKAVGKVEFPDHDFDIDAKIVFLAKNLDHASPRVLCRRWPIDNLNIDYDAFKVAPFETPRSFLAEHAVDGSCFPGLPLCTVCPARLSGLTLRTSHRGDRRRPRNLPDLIQRDLHAGRNHNFLSDLAVDRLYVIVPAAIVKNADHGGVRALDRSHNAPLRASIRTDRAHVDQYLIAVHGVPQLMGRDKDVANQPRSQRWADRIGVGNDEAEAIAVHGQTAGHQILVATGLGQGVMVGIGSGKLSAGDQLLQAIVKLPAGASL